MKTRKLVLVLVLVVILLMGTVLVASATTNVRLTGGANNSFFGIGWEWIVANVSLDPVTHETKGIVRYRVKSYDLDYSESWIGEPVCGAMGEFGGVPTMALVIKIVEVKNIDPEWVGKFLKITVSDGGQNASKDILGIVVWDFFANSPVPEQPSCNFEEPLVDYPSLNGNLMIHD